VGQAPDGMYVRDASTIHSLDFERGVNEADLNREVRAVAENVAALSHAPLGDTYNGPVLFEGAAAAQLFAELLARNLVLARRPVSEPGRPNTALTSQRGYYSWLAWYLGEGLWKSYGPRNPRVRPNVPRVIGAAWWARERAFVARRST